MLNKELNQGGSVQDILQITIYFFQTQTWRNEDEMNDEAKELGSEERKLYKGSEEKSSRIEIIYE